MISVCKSIHRTTSAETDLINITNEVSEIVSSSGVHSGIVTVFIPGSTASITTIEYESGALSDLKNAIERMAPRELHYEHDARWGDGNGYSHVRSALLGPSISIPVRDGYPALGTWQQIILCDFDNQPRTREVLVQVLGKGMEED